MAEALPRHSSNQVLCRYFTNGACRLGDNCRFSHDRRNSKPSQVCRYYQQGRCSYGNRCRFDHIRPDLNTSSTEHAANETESERSQTPNTRPGRHKATPSVGNMVSLKKSSSNNNKSCHEKSRNGAKWAQAAEFVPGKLWKGAEASSYCGAAKKGLEHQPSSLVIRSEKDAALCALPDELCPFAAAGECRFGDTCEYVHGDTCDICGRAVLVPGDTEQNEQHTRDCIRVIKDDMEESFAAARSAKKTCGICMDIVVEKQPPSEAKFGILSNCNHVFCLGCIRKWRQAKQFENKIVRACPECRVTSDFVTPSQHWVETKEEKDKVIQGYKDVLSKKPCKYFKQGAGECPFYDSCFYKHAYPDGRPASPRPRRCRARRGQDGELCIMDQLLLWEFLEARETRGHGDEILADLLDLDDLFIQLRVLRALQGDTSSEDSDYDVDDDVDITSLF